MALAACILSAQESPKKAAKPEAKVVDPVCGMTVDPKTADKSVYKGKTYYFCSRSEKQQFDKTPEKYLVKK
ncbi:MAG: YHS domain-containing protein [Acidobacteria bacterium]|nr:YHS domain-containing protein [Acidobacteriota bacterium]